MLADIGQVLVHELLLQSHRSSGDDQALTQGLRQGNSGDRIGNRFARACARFDHAYGGRGRARTARLRVDARQGVGNFRNHLPLPPARLKALGTGNGRVGLANLLLESVAQQGAGCPAASFNASLVATALA